MLLSDKLNSRTALESIESKISPNATPPSIELKFFFTNKCKPFFPNLPALLARILVAGTRPLLY